MKEVREQRRAEAEKRKAEAKAKRDQQKRAEAMEMQILTLEGRQKEIAAELEKPEAYDAGGAGDAAEPGIDGGDGRVGEGNGRVGAGDGRLIFHAKAQRRKGAKQGMRCNRKLDQWRVMVW